TAWTRHTRKRSRRGARSSERRRDRLRPAPVAAARLLLLSADPGHRRPAPGGDGEVAVADRLGRDRADDAGVRAGGAERPAGPAGVRPADGAGPAGRPREGGLAVRLRLLLGTAAPARQGDRAGAARDRLDAVRAPYRARRPSRAPLRLRAHDLAPRVRPHDRPRPAPPRRSLGRRRPRRLDVRAAPP